MVTSRAEPERKSRSEVIKLARSRGYLVTGIPSKLRVYVGVEYAGFIDGDGRPTVDHGLFGSAAESFKGFCQDEGIPYVEVGR